MDTKTRKGVIRWFIREISGACFVALTLFLPAGTLKWGWGWALVAVYLGWTVTTAIVLIPRCPELLAERGKRSPNMKRWDTTIVSIIGILTLVKQILAGLDFRWGWTEAIPLWLRLLALVIAVLSFVLVTWAMSTNAFFSLVVRIQDERGHQVATGGPYGFVRHPSYLGTVLFELATPLVLGSLWALLPGVIAAGLFVLRTALEDRTLQQELPGYSDYTRKTKYRLLPGIW